MLACGERRRHIGSMDAFAQLVDDFSFLSDWEDRYRHVIELGKTLAPLAESERNENARVRGCAAQVWLVSERGSSADPILSFRGDSDAVIVRGLNGILFMMFYGKRDREILALDARAELARLSLAEHLSAQRANGLFSMVERIRTEAARAMS